MVVATQILPILRDVVIERGMGELHMPPKRSIYLGPGHFFQTMIAASPSKDIAVCKWIGLAPGDSAVSGQQSHATILVSQLSTAKPIATLPGDAITVERTTAMSLLAFTLSGRPLPATLGFVGGGKQAIAHLRAFLDVAQGSVTNVLLYEPRPRGAGEFARICRDHQVSFSACSAANEVLVAADVLVTTVPGTSESLRFLDPRQVKHSAFISAVDLGRSWLVDGMSEQGFQLVTDDLEQTNYLISGNNYPLPGPFLADLPGLITGKGPGLSGRSPIMFSFAGCAYGDLAGVVTHIQQGGA